MILRLVTRMMIVWVWGDADTEYDDGRDDEEERGARALLVLIVVILGTSW
jgi:hypothetical protein